MDSTSAEGWGRCWPIRSSSLGRKLAQAGLKGRVPTAVIVTEEFLRVSPVLRAYTNYLTFVVT